MHSQLQAFLEKAEIYADPKFTVDAATYDQWVEQLRDDAQEILSAARRHGAAPVKLQTQLEHLLEIKRLIGNHHIIKQYERKEEYKLGVLLPSATDSEKRFKKKELQAYAESEAIFEKLGKANFRLSNLSKYEFQILKLDILTGILLEIRYVIIGYYEDLLE